MSESEADERYLSVLPFFESFKYSLKYRANTSIVNLLVRLCAGFPLQKGQIIGKRIDVKT